MKVNGLIHGGLGSARQAIRKARDLYNEGGRYVVDLDLSKYFGTIDHGLLLNTAREDVREKAVIRLIKQSLKSGVARARAWLRSGTEMGNGASTWDVLSVSLTHG